MLGFKNFHSAQTTIAGIESVRMIQKGQITGTEKSNSSWNGFVKLMA
jgi:putative transposase